uniref:Uncharacterized protein n=1 Tax=Cacopsylla melanoneura TaxID=428564 RepID=A0A8D8RH26_9HEMI
MTAAKYTVDNSKVPLLIGPKPSNKKLCWLLLPLFIFALVWLIFSFLFLHLSLPSSSVSSAREDKYPFVINSNHNGLLRFFVGNSSQFNSSTFDGGESSGSTHKGGTDNAGNQIGNKTDIRIEKTNEDFGLESATVTIDVERYPPAQVTSQETNDNKVLNHAITSEEINDAPDKDLSHAITSQETNSADIKDPITRQIIVDESNNNYNNQTQFNNNNAQNDNNYNNAQNNNNQYNTNNNNNNIFTSRLFFGTKPSLYRPISEHSTVKPGLGSCALT